MEKFFNFFKSKGAFATLLGILFAAPINLYIMVKFFQSNIDLSRQQLIAALVLNGIAMVWFILPSKIIVSSKFFNLTIED